MWCQNQLFYWLIGDPSESTWPSSHSNGEGHTCRPRLQGDAHDRGTAASVQSWPTHHYVPHPRVQMVSHAPEAAHWPAVCTGEWRPCLEKVCETLNVCLIEAEGGRVSMAVVICQITPLYHIYWIWISIYILYMFYSVNCTVNCPMFYIMWKNACA